jgi:FkbM family methyltransferase
MNSEPRRPVEELTVASDKAYPYIARDRRCDELVFDFLIADSVGASWYGDVIDQAMPERDWCRGHIHPGDFIIDCGAHHGMMAVLFGLWSGPTGRVISYEALPWNADVARENVKLNCLANVEVRGVGLSDRSHRLTATTNEKNVIVGHAGVVPLEGVTVEVDLVRLDDDLGRVKVDFLKVDVEGSDLQALRGAQRLLRSRPTVDLELHNALFEDRIKTLTEIFGILGPRSYRYEILPVFSTPEWVCVENGLPDLEWLATYDNPHVGCVPRRPRRANFYFPPWRGHSRAQRSDKSN